MGLLETLLVGSYIFTGTCYAFVFWVYRQLSNHMAARVKKLERAIFGKEDEPGAP
jgi:hypothetical protein